MFCMIALGTTKPKIMYDASYMLKVAFPDADLGLMK